jgi:hypothetical protein
MLGNWFLLGDKTAHGHKNNIQHNEHAAIPHRAIPVVRDRGLGMRCCEAAVLCFCGVEVLPACRFAAFRLCGNRDMTQHCTTELRFFRNQLVMGGTFGDGVEESIRTALSDASVLHVLNF